jgi:hypothetical protein
MEDGVVDDSKFHIEALFSDRQYIGRTLKGSSVTNVIHKIIDMAAEKGISVARMELSPAGNKYGRRFYLINAPRISVDEDGS